MVGGKSGLFARLPNGKNQHPTESCNCMRNIGQATLRRLLPVPQTRMAYDFVSRAESDNNE